MKTCTKCKVPKEEGEFYRDSSKLDGLRYECKECRRASERLYREKNWEKISLKKKIYRNENLEEILSKKKVYEAENRTEISAKNKARWTKTRGCKYGLALGEFDRMVVQQGGVCAICGSSGGTQRLSVDHDHGTGKVRALLCGPCNRGLGMFKDSSALILKASEYLASHGK